MPNLLQVLLLVLVPLAWGLSVEVVFDRMRRRKVARMADPQV